MDADDLALIDLGRVADEEVASVLQVPERVAERLAGRVRDEHAVLPAADVAAQELVVLLEGVAIMPVCPMMMIQSRRKMP